MRAILGAIRETEWGSRQELVGFFDEVTKGLLEEISALWSVLGVEGLNLESVMTDCPTLEASTSKDDIFHPSQMLAVNESVEALVGLNSVKAAPLLLGWAFILSKVTESFLERGVPELYTTFAVHSLHLDVHPTSTAVSIASNRKLTQSLFQLYASHALSPSSSLFASLLTTLRSSLFRSDSNTLGYLSVLRSVVTSLPLVLRLPFLTSDQFSDLVKVFSELYGNVAAAPLCAQFWEEHGLNAGYLRGMEGNGEAEIIGLARGRFPVQFGNLVSIVQALSKGVGGIFVDGGTPEDEELAQRCGDCTFDYLATLDTLTHIVPPSSTATSLPYIIIPDADPSQVLYQATRPIPVSKSISIPAGTIGRLVSQRGKKSVVISWSLEWSAWRLFADVLDDFAGGKKVINDVFGGAVDVSLPIEWTNDEEKLESIANVVELFSIALNNNPSLGGKLVDHLASAQSSDSESIPIIETLFAILERSISSRQTLPTRIVSSLLELIAAFLPSFPGAIWTFLRGSTLLFQPQSTSSAWRQDPNRQAIIATEKTKGVYPVTLSLLSLVQALVLEEQVSSYVVSPVLATMKQEVLVRALVWVKENVWSEYSTWKFSNLVDKYEIGKKIVEIYSLVLEEAELSPEATRGEFGLVGNVVVDSLLNKATILQLTPLLVNIAQSPDTIIGLRKSARYLEAQAAEELTTISLQLIARLLQLRRRIVGSTVSLLENLLLAHGKVDSRSHRGDLVENLSRFVVAPVGTKVAVQSAKVLTLLCIGLNGELSKTVSFGVLLGGSEKVENVVTELLEIASDPFADESLLVAIWDLVRGFSRHSRRLLRICLQISSIVEGQPSLAMLFITGRHYPFANSVEDKGKGKATDQTTDISTMISTPFFRPLPRTAIGVALEVVSISTETFPDSPALLAAVLRFLDFLFQFLTDFGSALDDCRNRPEFWTAIAEIAFTVVGARPVDEEQAVVGYCHKVIAKSHAVRILALDLQLSLSQKTKTSETASSKALVAMMVRPKEFSKAIAGATASSFDPGLHQDNFDHVAELFPILSVDALRKPTHSHPLDSRSFGSDYLFSIPLLRRKLDGLISHYSTVDGQDPVQDAIARIHEINFNYSLVDAQISHTRAWRQLLEIALPVLRSSTAVAVPAQEAAALVAAAVAGEERGGQVSLVLHSERLSILLALVDVTAINSATQGDIAGLVNHLSNIVNNESLPPLDSIAVKIQPRFHHTLFALTYSLYRRLNLQSTPTALTPEQQSAFAASTDAILQFMILGTRDLFVRAQVTQGQELASDLSLAVGVLGQLIRSNGAPTPSLWLSYCQTSSLFHVAFDVFARMDGVDGRPLYAQSVLDLCISMAAFTPRAAESMAVEGIMAALTNNALTAQVEAGAIIIVSADGQRTPQHEIWTSILALVVALVSALGGSTQFVQQEVTGFVRLYASQIRSALSWIADSRLTLAGLEELDLTISLLHGVVGSSAGVVSKSIASIYFDSSLFLLQQIVYSVLHPNQLISLVEPVTLEEQAWLEGKGTTGEGDASESQVRSVVFALLRIATKIVDSLLLYTYAVETLTRDSSEWKVEGAIISPVHFFLPSFSLTY